MEPHQTSGMYPVWSRTARDFASRLEALGTGRAQFLATRMWKYASEFDSWESGSKPTADEKARRAGVISGYMTCYRDSLDIFSGK